MQSSPPASNNWHFASISKFPCGGVNSFTWQNKAGVEWGLTFIEEESSGVLKFKVGEKWPFNNKEWGS